MVERVPFGDGTDLNEDGDRTDAPNAETLQEAKDTGWVPKEDFRGNPDHWVDAGTWVERGRTLAPLVKAQNAGLRRDLESTRGENARLAGELRAVNASLNALRETQERNDERTAKDTLAQLKQQIKEASEAGDHGLVADLTEQMTDLKIAQAAKPPADDPNKNRGGNGNGNGNGQDQISPDFKAWLDAGNATWYGRDADRTDLADYYGKRVARQGFRGAEFFKELDKELAKVAKQARNADTVDRYGEGGSGDRGGDRGSGKKGYNDLPAEARRECDKDIERRSGAGKKFKDANAWRQYYADQYFAGEQ